MQLSLDCLTLTDSTPDTLIHAAAQAGFELVSLWCNPIAIYPNQQFKPLAVPRLQQLLRNSGIRVHQIEAFDLASEPAIQAMEPTLEAGALLGAESVLVYHGANPDHSEVAALLAQTTELAGQYRIKVNLEPIAMGRTRTLAEAEALIVESGTQANILFDTLHFFRSGQQPADLSAVDRERIGYVQLNDGPLTLPADQWQREAAGERLYPGEGEFPLGEVLGLLPRDVPWAIEAPSLRRASRGESPAEQASAAMRALKDMLKSLPTTQGQGVGRL